MSRTNIELDDELVDSAMRRYRVESKRAAVQLALDKLVGEPMTRAEVLAMQGTGTGSGAGGRCPRPHLAWSRSGEVHTGRQ